MDMEREKLGLQYFRVLDIWKRFCELHSLLYDFTCEEYTFLLSSDLEKLEETLKKKEEIIIKIDSIEKLRQEILLEINMSLPEEKRLKKASDLIDYLMPYAGENEQNLLNKMNRLLIDIIETIQKQNKKNQIFLNKAIHSITELKRGISGNRSYETYNAKGVQKTDVLK